MTESITQLLREEIVRISNTEPLNTMKLSEYIRMLERLTSFERMSVEQVHQQELMTDNISIPQMPVYTGRPYDNIGSMMDVFKELAHDLKMPKRHEIDEYMYWIRFIKDLEEDIKNYKMTDRLDNEIDNFRYKLYERIIELMKEKFEENIKKDLENKEKESKDSKIVLNSIQTF